MFPSHDREAPLNGIEGIDPVSDGENRIFWNDRFVEPKQQHRFTVHFPVYTPVGKNKDIIDLVENIIPSALGPGVTKFKKFTEQDIIKKLYSEQVAAEEEQANVAARAAAG